MSESSKQFGSLVVRRAATVANGGTARETRLSQAIDEFYACLDAGRSPDRQSLLEKYADIADELQECLRSLDFVQHVSPQLSAADGAKGASPLEGGAAGILGDFRILQEIGRGGMGVVYEAEQISLGRRVALKVLPFAAMLDKQQLTRFKNEARAAATLDHPNIVAIYSVGVERSVHFYAMQLIEGQSLAEVIAAMCQRRGSNKNVSPPPPCGEGPGEGVSNRNNPTIEHRSAICNRQSASSSPAAAGNPQSAIETSPLPLPPSTLAAAHFSTLPDFSSREYFRAIARLGIQAAEALDHAHQHGILHRDIKPANLLIESNSPSPLRGGPGRGADGSDHLKLWITDFGLARIEQDAGVTMTGDLLGTLRYMSPEQALAKRVVVDHRSDIYSLGVTLYELLTLQPAYTADDRQELLRQIAFEEPRPPRKLDRRIPAELETIILKAIEKNPADRYETAQRLADDLRAYLDDHPIKAKPPTLVSRTKKWSRRHKPLVTSASLAVTAILVISFALLASSNLAIKREQDKTHAALEEKATALQDRTAALNRSEWNYKTALDAVDQLLARVGNEKLAEVPQLDQLRMDVLQDTLKFYELFAAQNPGDRKVQFELAKTYRRVGTMHLDFGRYATGALYREKAIAILEPLRQLDPVNPSYRYELAVALTERGWCGPLGSFGPSIFHRRAVDLLQALCDDDPDNIVYKDALADGLRSLAECYLGDFPKIGKSVDVPSVRTVLERAHAASRLPGVNKRFLAHAHEYSGFLAVCEKRLDDAEREYHEATRVHLLAVADRPLEGRAREHLVRAYIAMGDLFEQREDWVHAAEQYREATKVGEQLRRDFPAMYHLHDYLTSAINRLARVLKVQQRLDEIKQLAEKISPTTINDYRALAGLHTLVGEKELATSAFQEVLERSKAVVTNGQFDLTAGRAYFAALDRVGSRQAALTFVRSMTISDIESIATRVRLYDLFTAKELTPNDRNTVLDLTSRLIDAFPIDAYTIYKRCNLYRQRHEFNKALEDADRLIIIDPIANNYNLRGNIYSELKQQEQGIDDFSEAIRLSPEVDVYYANRAQAYHYLRRDREAIAEYETVLEAKPESWRSLNNLAWLLATLPDEKLRDGERAVELAVKACKLTDYRNANIVSTLAAAYAEAGDFEKAIEWATKAIELTGEDKELLAALKKHLASYEAHKPWRRTDEYE